MKTKFISEHKDYWLVVDENAWIGHEELHYSQRWNELHSHKGRNNEETCHKIIGYYPKHKDAPEIEGVPLMVEMPMVEDVDVVSDEYRENFSDNSNDRLIAYIAFKDGYKRKV